MTSLKGGSVGGGLEISTVFADSIVFKQYIYLDLFI